MESLPILRVEDEISWVFGVVGSGQGRGEGEGEREGGEEMVAPQG
jgi:hypothetical protein